MKKIKKTKKNSFAKVVRKKARSKKNFFPIVAIGASAGGLEAVSELLKNLSPSTGMAYVYVQHLDPTHESMLRIILSRTTKMPVLEAKDKLRMKPNHFYIIPPNKDLTVANGTLKLNQREAGEVVHLSINRFFKSLAEKHKEGAIGIVLSGNANDGALGLKAIKLAGGLTFAQDESAKFQSMPRAAIAEGAVDMILSPKEIAKELGRHVTHGTKLRPVMSEKEDTVPDGEQNDYTNIIELLRKSSGVDFNLYKKNTIHRRILRRMLLYRIGTLKQYATYLKQHAKEVNILYQDLLINVTSFFRDPDAMDYLKSTLFPRILKTKKGNDPVRIWVPACSTGEEAYSIAIILLEVLGERGPNTPIQIFATDLSETAIAKARLGIYSRNELSEISPKRLQNFFSKVDGSYRIEKNIRDLCVFAVHNIFKDPPFSRLDLVSCCNLLIYLDTTLQRKVMGIFHYSLNSPGYLMLGKSETTGTAQNLFTPLEKRLKIYARKENTSAKTIFDMSQRMPRESADRYNISQIKIPLAEKSSSAKRGSAADIEKTVDNILLTRYVPACVVIDDDLDILQFRGSTGLFLEPSPGRASLNLLKMARPGLAFELRNAVHKVKKNHKPCTKAGIEINQNGESKIVSIEVIPLPADNGEKHYLVLFREMDMALTSALPESVVRTRRIKQLEQELLASREDMRSIVEEQEAVNEELQSANEEIVSSNEELQSINEELETSKEEVESTNEELTTINQELQVRNDQLGESYEYSEAVLETIREAILVLDSDLRVKSANHSFYKMFHAKGEFTEGRLIYELGNGQWNIPGLRRLLEDIIPNNNQFFGYEVSHIFPDIGEKTMMLNARRIIQRAHHQRFILVAIEDTTEYAKAQRIISEREEWFRAIADNSPALIWTATPDKQRNFFNKSWLEFTGRVAEQEKGMGWTNDVHKEDLDHFLKVYHTSIDKRKPFEIEYRLRRHDGQYRWVRSIGKPMYSPEDKFTGYIGTCYEIHDQRTASEELERGIKENTTALREANYNLERINSELKQFAYVASHDLQEPLRKIITFSDLMRKSPQGLNDRAKEYVGKIMESSLRMKQLVEDLLNYSSADATKKKFARTDLNQILEEVLKDFDAIITNENAQVNGNHLPVIYAVPVQMKQLFHNLISNSLKFRKADVAPVISIDSRKLAAREVNGHPRLKDGTDYCEIIFKDNGIGFSKKFSNQVFEIFQRLHEKEKYEGTGIGLALCKKIAHNHGGEIFVDSTEDKGTTFRIILPMKNHIAGGGTE